MKRTMKRVVALLSLVVLLIGMIYVPMEANAANEFYGDYTDVAKIYDYGSCPSMQGLAVGSQMLYTIKINSDDSKAFISMTDKDTSKTTKLYNSDAAATISPTWAMPTIWTSGVLTVIPISLLPPPTRAAMPLSG